MVLSTQTHMTELRKTLLDPQRALTCYAARNDYLQKSTWLQVPIFDAKLSSNTHIGILCDIQRCSLYTSTIIGRVNTDDLFVRPQGDCTNPYNIADASLRLSLSSPELPGVCTFDKDFGIALRHLKELAISANMLDIPANHMIDIHRLNNCIRFYYPLMFEGFSVCVSQLNFCVADICLILFASILSLLERLRTLCTLSTKAVRRSILTQLWMSPIAINRIHSPAHFIQCRHPSLRHSRN